MSREIEKNRGFPGRTLPVTFRYLKTFARDCPFAWSFGKADVPSWATRTMFWHWI